MSKVVGTFGGKGHGEWWEYNTPIPGTHEPGFAVPEVVAMPLPVGLRETLHGALVLPLAFFRMEECSIIRAREPEGIHGEKRRHLSISHPDRTPLGTRSRLRGTGCLSRTLPSRSSCRRRAST